MFISYSVSDPGREFPGSFAVLEPPGPAERNLLQAYMPKVVLHHLNDIAPNSRECGFGDCCFFNAAERRVIGYMV